MALQDLLISRPVSVVTPVISSLAAALRKYVEGLFPAGYFSSYFIDTELPGLRPRRTFRPMSQSQLAMRQLPLLSVRVEATADSSDFASGVSWETGNLFLQQPESLTRLIYDDAAQRFVGFHFERMVLRFQITFVVETDYKARELLMFLRRVAPINRRVFLNDVHIATELPGDILRAIWRDLGLGSGADPAEIARFQRYLRSVTAGDVEQVVNSASGRTAFAFSYAANPVMSIQSAPSMSVNRDGGVVRNAQVELPLDLDLAVPMTYAYRQVADVAAPATPDDLESYIGGDSGAYFGRAFYSRPPEVIDGDRRLVGISALVSGDLDPASPRAPDVTDLSQCVTAEVLAYIRDRGANSCDPAAFLWLDGVAVDPADWTFDMDTFQLELRWPSLQPRQKYHFGLYCNLERFSPPDAAGQRAPGESPYY